MRVECWEDREKTILRPTWDKEHGNVGCGNGAVNKMGLGRKRRPDLLEACEGNRR